MRAALYYAPRPGDALHHAGAAWLGHDPESGATPPPPSFPGIDPALLHAATASPRHYGLHATLTPPRRLATGWEEFAAAAAALAERTPAFPLPPLHITEMSGCLALTTPDCPTPPSSRAAAPAAWTTSRNACCSAGATRTSSRAGGST